MKSYLLLDNQSMALTYRIESFDYLCEDGSIHCTCRACTRGCNLSHCDRLVRFATESKSKLECGGSLSLSSLREEWEEDDEYNKDYTLIVERVRHLIRRSKRDVRPTYLNAEETYQLLHGPYSLDLIDRMKEIVSNTSPSTVSRRGFRSADCTTMSSPLSWTGREPS